MSHRAASLFLLACLAGCGPRLSASSSIDAVPASSDELAVTEAGEAAADEAPTEASEEPQQECRRDWPRDDSDPRDGFYVFERALDDYHPYAVNAFFRYDGPTLTMVWLPSHNFPLSCSYGMSEDLAGLVVRRMRARVTEDGRLFALVPCQGERRPSATRGRARRTHRRGHRYLQDTTLATDRQRT